MAHRPYPDRRARDLANPQSGVPSGVGAVTGREIRQAVEWPLDPNPRIALAGYRLLTIEYLPWIERQLVWRSRKLGKSWMAIARVLGRSRQAIQQRFDGVTTIDELIPPRLPDPLGTDEADRRQMIADLRRRCDADDAAACGSLVAW